MEPQKISILTKIISILSFLSALISGFWSFWFFAFSGFTPGFSFSELSDIGIFFVIAVFLVVLGIFTWKGMNWAKYLACLFIIGILICSYIFFRG